MVAWHSPACNIFFFCRFFNSSSTLLFACGRVAGGTHAALIISSLAMQSINDDSAMSVPLELSYMDILSPIL